jgi:hypothetical protein
MVFKFTTSFSDIVYNILKKEKTNNQILSDIHLLLEEIRIYISGIDSPENYLKSFSSPFIKAIEYNNALLLTALHPANIKYFLNSILTEKRYYFFNTVCDMLLNSNLKNEYKKEVLEIHKEASEKYKIFLYFKEYEISKFIFQICEGILNILMERVNSVGPAIKYIENKLEISLSSLSINNLNLREKVYEIIVSSLKKYEKI